MTGNFTIGFYNKLLQGDKNPRGLSNMVALLSCRGNLNLRDITINTTSVLNIKLKQDILYKNGKPRLATRMLNYFALNPVTNRCIPTKSDTTFRS